MTRPIVAVVFATFDSCDPKHPAKLQLVYERRDDWPWFGVRDVIAGTTTWRFTYELARDLYSQRCEEHGAPTFRAVAGGR